MGVNEGEVTTDTQTGQEEGGRGPPTSVTEFRTGAYYPNLYRGGGVGSQ